MTAMFSPTLCAQLGPINPNYPNYYKFEEVVWDILDKICYAVRDFTVFLEAAHLRLNRVIITPVGLVIDTFEDIKGQNKAQINMWDMPEDNIEKYGEFVGWTMIVLQERFGGKTGLHTFTI